MHSKSVTHIIDFQKIKTPDDLHEYFKTEFAFPDYYGMNWDAFWDCMTELLSNNQSVNIEVRCFPQFENKYPQNAKIMQNLFAQLEKYDEERCRQINAYSGNRQRHKTVNIRYIDHVNEASSKEK